MIVTCYDRTDRQNQFPSAATLEKMMEALEVGGKAVLDEKSPRFGEFEGDFRRFSGYEPNPMIRG